MADYTLTAKLTADTKGFQAGFEKAQQSLANMQNKIISTGQTVQQAGKQMMATGGKLTLGVTAPIVALGKSATVTGLEFESSMSKVQAISGATGKDFDDLEKKARELGASTTFSASEAGDGLQYLALAGWEVEEMLGGIDPVLHLAEAGALDLGRASDLVTDSMSALGVEVKDLDVYLDQVAQTSRKSNTDIDALMEAMVIAGGKFRDLNVPLEESNAMLGVLANRGFKGSEAGTAMNAILTRLTATTGPSAKALKELGISAFDSEGNFRGMEVVMKDVEKSLSKMDDEQRAHYQTQIAGLNHGKSFSAMLSGLGDEYDDLKGSIKDSNGALGEMRDTMTDNLMGRIEGMKSALADVQIEIYKALQPTLEKLVETITNAAIWFTSLPASTQGTIIAIAALAAAVGPVIAGFGLFLTVIGTAISGLGLLLSPIGLIIGGLAALGVALGIAMVKNESFREKVFNVFESIREIVSNVVSTVTPILQSMWEGAKDGVSSFVDNIGSILSTIGSILSSIIGAVKEFASGLIEGFSGAGGEVKSLSSIFIAFNPVLKMAMLVLSEFGPQIAQGFSQIASMALPLLNLLGQSIGQLAAAIIPMVLNVISALLPVIMNLGMIIMEIAMAIIPILIEVFMQLLPIVMMLVDTVAGIIAQVAPLVAILVDSLVPIILILIETIMNVVSAVAPALIAILGVVASAFGAIVPVVMGLLTVVINVVANIISTIAPIIAFIAGVISTIISIVAPIVTFIAGIMRSIFSAITPIISFASGVFSTVFSVISGVFRNVLSFITGIIRSVSSVIGSLSGVVSGVFNRIFSIASSVMSSVGSVITGIFSSIQSAWTGLTGFVSGVFSGIGSAVQTLVNQVKGFVNGVIGGINAAVGLINKIPGVSISKIPQLYRGTDNWAGGFAYMNEGGRGELAMLPGGTQVIPHDVSMKYAREAGRQNGMQAGQSFQTVEMGRVEKLLEMIYDKDTAFYMNDEQFAVATNDAHDRINGNKVNLNERWGR